MPAPIIGFVIAFLTGAALPVATAEATFGSAAQAIIVVDQKAATVYAKLPAICAAIDPALDRLSDAVDAAKARSRWRRVLAFAADRLARDADIVCKDVKAPNTPAGQTEGRRRRARRHRASRQPDPADQGRRALNRRTGARRSAPTVEAKRSPTLMTISSPAGAAAWGLFEWAATGSRRCSPRRRLHVATDAAPASHRSALTRQRQDLDLDPPGERRGSAASRRASRAVARRSSSPARIGRRAAVSRRSARPRGAASAKGSTRSRRGSTACSTSESGTTSNGGRQQRAQSERNAHRPTLAQRRTRIFAAARVLSPRARSGRVERHAANRADARLDAQEMVVAAGAK